MPSAVTYELWNKVESDDEESETEEDERDKDLFLRIWMTRAVLPQF